jgi:hypothetical protein
LQNEICGLHDGNQLQWEEIQYIGVTIQEFWKRIYQHLTIAYKEYVRGSITNGRKRSLYDEIVALFDDPSTEPDILKKKAFVQFMAGHVKVRPLAWLRESSDLSKEGEKRLIHETEAVCIEELHTLTHGANRNVGMKLSEGHSRKIDPAVHRNFNYEHSANLFGY